MYLLIFVLGSKSLIWNSSPFPHKYEVRAHKQKVHPHKQAQLSQTNHAAPHYAHGVTSSYSHRYTLVIAEMKCVFSVTKIFEFIHISITFLCVCVCVCVCMCVCARVCVSVISLYERMCWYMNCRRALASHLMGIGYWGQTALKSRARTYACTHTRALTHTHTHPGLEWGHFSAREFQAQDQPTFFMVVEIG